MPEAGRIPMRGMRIGLALAVLLALVPLAFRLPARAGGGQACVWGRVVGLDAGHGGADPGAIRGGHREAPIVLAITRRLRDLLVSVGMRPVLTRQDDGDLSGGSGDMKADRAARVEILNRAAPDVVLSIHANAFPAGQWYGAQVFYNNRFPQSRLLAEAIQKQLGALTDTQGRQALDQIEHFILDRVDAPAATVEVGFLSNAREADLLADPTYQARLAWAVLRGLIDYFSRSRCPA